MNHNMSLKQKYNYIILQQGSLTLKPDGMVDYNEEHRCTITLIWPIKSNLQKNNSLLIDPCFSNQSLLSANSILDDYKISLSEIQNFFITHNHSDHLPDYSLTKITVDVNYIDKDDNSFIDIDIYPCPGHSDDSKCLYFKSKSNKNVCITGDTILNKDWLKAWQYYWPNGYTKEEVIKTWASVCQIVSNADIIIPGHGKPFNVTKDLLKYLIDNFSSAQYSYQSKNSIEIIKNRYNSFI